MKKSSLHVLGIAMLMCLLSVAQTSKDSIVLLLDKSADAQFSEEKRFQWAERANTLAKALDNDSLYLKTNRNVALYYYSVGDFDTYLSVNHNIIKLSKRLNDTLPLARAYFGIASALQLQNKKMDSVYYYYFKCIPLFDKLKLNVELSYSLGNLSGIQLMAKDYFKADENAIRGLEALKFEDNTTEILDQKWILYTRLGSIANALDNKEKAIEYYEKAYSTAEKMIEIITMGFMH